MDFECEPKKADENTRKHRVTFEEAATVFGDPLALTFLDPDHSFEERRYLTFGISKAGRLLVVNIPNGVGPSGSLVLGVP